MRVGDDWQHKAAVYNSKELIAVVKEDDSDDKQWHDPWVDCECYDVPGVEDGANVRTVHVLFHFYDNYVDAARIYASRDTAEQQFWQCVKEQHEDVAEETANEDLQSKVVTTISTCYEHGNKSTPQFTSTVYVRCSIDDVYEYPDKGNRWVLVTLPLIDSNTLEPAETLIR